MTPVPQVKGWCPDAFRPMTSGDGLILRVRPRAARLTGADLHLLCDIAERCGNGIIDLTNRANLQLRGLSAASHAAALDRLLDARLVDADPQTERRRGIVIDPLWQPGDLSRRLHDELAARLPDFPDLPAKAGFAIDCGTQPRLAGVSGDIRFELDAQDGLIVRAEGAASGRPVTPAQAVGAALDLAHWYARKTDGSRGRLRDILHRNALPAVWQQVPPRAETGQRMQPSRLPQGQLLALPFGQATSGTLRFLADAAPALRLTPWRMVLAEGAAGLSHPGLLTAPDDPLLHIDACPGAPRCASAHVDTHALARRLAPLVTGSLHVSGCAKGCARRAPADLTVIGTDRGFDIVRHGNTHASPARTGVAADDILAEMT